MNQAWQRILTVNEYYDGPVFGVAEVDGVPHVYEREWDAEMNVYGPKFMLAPIEADLLELVLEDWAIWLRWDAAFKRREVDETSHPALLSERARHEEIRALVGDRFDSKRGGQVVKYGHLEIRDREWRVMWRDEP
jgi:hypothetical protein